MGAEPDFSGYATKANLVCSDGRTIAPDAFKDQDKATVPLVWQHGHNDPTNVLGHAVLENRSDGVYCHAFFNATDKGKASKIMVEHGDVTQLSIYANRLMERSKNVIHGVIREVSLVLAGANPGATIDFINFAHSDGRVETLDDEAVIYTGLPIEHDDLDDEDEGEDDDDTEVEEAEEESDEDGDEDEVEHADSDDNSVRNIYDSMTEDHKALVHYAIGAALNSKIQHTDDLNAENSDEKLEHSDKTVGEVYDTMSEQQRNVMFYMTTQAIEKVKEQNTAAHSEAQEGSTTMPRTNVFEQQAGQQTAGATGGATATLSHDDMKNIFEEANRGGSLKKAASEYIAHKQKEGVLQHGIQDIDILFPDAKAVTNTPEWLKRRTEWVSDVMNGTRHTPFSRIKSMTANLTLLEARAKGYVKGSFKEEEFFRVAKRVTTPTTVYKKQQLDRDDMLDITDFDVVAWLKGEMRIMLEEEIARAVLVGDGRSGGNPDKINEENIRPIATDNDLYVTKLFVNLGDSNSSAEEVIEAIIRYRSAYRGSGNPVLYCGETLLAQWLSVKDTLGRRIYQTVNDLTAVLRVSKIVAVEVMDEAASPALAIMVNLQDYTIGADRGGDVAMFDDFDIDFNQYKYLIETRCSGALTRAKSAIVIVKTASNAVFVEAQTPTWNAGAHSVTVPTTTGLTYKNKATNATLVTGTPIVLGEGQYLTVKAEPSSSGYALASNTADEFTYSYDGPQGSAF